MEYRTLVFSVTLALRKCFNGMTAHVGRQAWQSWGQTGRFILLLGLSLALTLTSPAIAQSIAQSTATGSDTLTSTELRGVWLTNVDSNVLYSRKNLREAIQRLDRLHFNTIYPTVWNGGYTLFPSRTAEQAIGEAVEPIPEFDDDRDMLEEAVELGHKSDLAVIPWFEFGLMAPAESELVRRHPDWVTNRKDGSQVFVMHEKEMVWLTPAHPDVQRLLIGMITEVVNRYDIDGIQLDDHFGMPVETGYDPYTVALYRQEHQGKSPPNNPKDPEWMRWRANKVTDLMIRVYSAVKTRKPDCLISVSPGPKEFSYQSFLQDWGEWNRLRFIDELIVQIYRTDFSRFSNELTRLSSQVNRSRIPVSVGILTGLRVLDVEMDMIQRQVGLTRDRKFSGMSFFFYETLGDRDDSFQALFPNPAPRPGSPHFQNS